MSEMQNTKHYTSVTVPHFLLISLTRLVWWNYSPVRPGNQPTQYGANFQCFRGCPCLIHQRLIWLGSDKVDRFRRLHCIQWKLHMSPRLADIPLMVWYSGHRPYENVICRKV